MSTRIGRWLLSLLVTTFPPVDARTRTVVLRAPRGPARAARTVRCGMYGMCGKFLPFGLWNW